MAAAAIHIIGLHELEALLSLAAEAIHTIGLHELEALVSFAAEAIHTIGLHELEALLSLVAEAIHTVGLHELEALPSFAAEAIHTIGLHELEALLSLADSLAALYYTYLPAPGILRAYGRFFYNIYIADLIPWDTPHIHRDDFVHNASSTRRYFCQSHNTLYKRAFALWRAFSV